MSKKLPILDTNIILRYLLNDTPVQVARIEKLFQAALPRSLQIPDVVIVEIVHVLESFYQLKKLDVVDRLHLLVEFEIFKTNKRLIKKTLEVYQKQSISFVDAYLIARVVTAQNTRLYTFDKRVD